MATQCVASHNASNVGRWHHRALHLISQATWDVASLYALGYYLYRFIARQGGTAFNIKKGFPPRGRLNRVV